MKTWKKVGLTALAGSLVAFGSANAEWSLSGSGKVTYTDDGNVGTGNTGNNNVDGDRWGIARDFSVSASTELDMGWTVTATHALSAGGADASSLAIDMGAMGTLKYTGHDGTFGLEVIDDIVPTAHEEVTDGLGVDGAVGSGASGWNYNNSMGDGMITVDIGVTSKASNTSTGNGTGGASGGTSGPSGQSIALQLKPIDGLTVYYGSGEYMDAAGASTQDDHETVGLKYAYGPVTVGYQTSEVDDQGTGNTDIDREMMSISYAVNDELSISYGETTADWSTTSTDEEATGFSASYTMGAMTITLHRNQQDNDNGNTSKNEIEHTELALSFSF